MIYFCSQKQRRAAVLVSDVLNGIDYLELRGDPGCATQVAITFLKSPRSLGLTPANILITGGAPVRAKSIDLPSGDDPLTILVQLDSSGDFSTYQLAVVAGAVTAQGTPVTDPPDGLDPQLATVEFSFKAGCPSPTDCSITACCPPASHVAPDINYLAKDYEAFRQLMLDRMAVLAPAWGETHTADLGVAMVEALAYAADHLSYQQDAVSTEAYIGTARSRISVRRHARLVDYQLSEGCNSRTWIYLEAIADLVSVPQGTRFYVRTPGLPTVVPALDPRVRQLLASPHPIFETLQDATLRTEQNQIDFYTWGDANCCLPSGATEATLVDHILSLSVGTVLIFEEVLGPDTGAAEDADPTHRWAVRLTSVNTTDYKGRPLVDPLTAQAITHVTWSPQDALPFPLCICATSDSAHGSIPVPVVSVARGNVIPADHGTWVSNESLGTVPEAPPSPQTAASCDCGARDRPTAPRPRFYPQLAQSPLTFSVPFDSNGPASTFLKPDSTKTTPKFGKVQSDDGRLWEATEDLMSSGSTAALFVPEIEQDAAVFLRFGDGTYGVAPEKGQSFTAAYRVGNGSVGNIGRDSLAHVVFEPNSIRAVRNPLAAAAGVDPETSEHARQWAPFEFQSQMRCVTEDDYGRMAVRPGYIDQARGTLRWTGSWHTAFVSIDPIQSLTSQLVTDTRQTLNLLRMMGIDIDVEGAIIVGLRIVLQICVAPDHFTGDVYAALMKLFVSTDRCDGHVGLLDASQFSFGDTVYASPLIAAAQAVDGVVAVRLTTFTRMDDPSVDGIGRGYLSMGRLELPRCDNDPNHLDHGAFQLHMDGGK